MNYAPYFERILAVLKKHGIVLILAATVGALCIAPNLYARYSLQSYAGIHMIGSDAEEHYDARIQEVRDGFPTAGNTFLPNKKIPALMPALAENVMAFFGNLLRLSTADLAEYSKFAFPFLATIVMYAFGYLLVGSRPGALIGAATVLLGDNLISGPAAWKAFVYGGTYVSGFLTYSRPINPELSGILFFAALIFVIRAFFSGRVPRWYEGVGIGILAGAAFYPSPYVASFVLCLVAVAGTVSIYQRDWNHVIAALAAGMTALVCLIPFALNYGAVLQSPSYADAAARLGAIPSHAPVF